MRYVKTILAISLAVLLSSIVNAQCAMCMAGAGASVASGGGGGGWTLIANVNGAGLSTPVTAAMNSTGANLIVVGITGIGISIENNLHDSKSNTWTQLTGYRTGASAEAVLYYSYNPTVGSGHTFDMPANTVAASIFALAYSGAGASPFDLESGGIGTSTSAQPGSISPTAGDLLVSVIMTSDNTGIAINSGFAIIDQIANNPGVNYPGAIATKVHTSGAINPTWSWTNSGEFDLGFYSFKAQ